MFGGEGAEYLATLGLFVAAGDTLEARLRGRPRLVPASRTRAPLPSTNTKGASPPPCLSFTTAALLDYGLPSPPLHHSLPIPTLPQKTKSFFLGREWQQVHGGRLAKGSTRTRAQPPGKLPQRLLLPSSRHSGSRKMHDTSSAATWQMPAPAQPCAPGAGGGWGCKVRPSAACCPSLLFRVSYASCRASRICHHPRPRLLPSILRTQVSSSALPCAGRSSSASTASRG